MKVFFVDKTLLAVGLTSHLGLLAGLLIWTYPDLKAKVHAEKNDRQVSLAVDWEDVSVFSQPGQEAVTLMKLYSVPVRLIMMNPACETSEETIVRANGFRVLWRLDDRVRPDPWFSRFQKGDVVFIAGEHVLEHPRMIRELPELLRRLDGFLCSMEFHWNPLLALIAGQVPDRVVKSHLLPTREMLLPKKYIWIERLIRAVRSRWARLLVVRFSPGFSLNENEEFISTVARKLTEQGYTIDEPRLFPLWTVGKSMALFAAEWRFKMVLFISLMTPVLAVWLARSYGAAFPWKIFLAINALTLLSGVVIHGLGAAPAAVLGIQILRGVKIQLAVPLFACAFFLCSRDEVANCLSQPIKLKHVLSTGAVIAVMLGLYLMRSGNYPLVPVFDCERRFRDILEQLFTARPRFKEFMIGQPMLLLGLLRRGEGGNFLSDGRLLLLFGIIGQISIMNTFTHFHSPFDLSLMRSMHGIWMGFVIALPFIPWIKKCK